MVRPKPLAGLRILDLTRLLPGPMCTLHLGDMGADVIKVEAPRGGDYARALGPSLFRLVNRNKRALKLDLSKPAGRDVFIELTHSADALVEAFRPGVMARLGLGYEALHALHPRLVYCSITGYGQRGPYRMRAGHDIDYCAYAGIVEQSGAGGGPPVLGNFQVADLAGGALSAAMGILAALLDVQRGGEGRHVDVSMTDCALAHAVVPLATWLEEGATRPRGADTLTGGLPCYGVYETGDGRYMALGALEHKFWRAFCEAVGRPDLSDRHLVSGEEAEAVRAEVAA
ncbi:MAG: CoA transferase, partial [Gammaproteobacteria bacterium]|nr:CoA transferase [Gammaproteobacteria bacterium]NIR85785.1 CoA transferase [Gammaproteobacteria bacterium]NIR90539.1 CoA transferase [Gammaproteobacteria bacterium]NIU06920.1 CoA transferase [Gammaproteobacteria bacterium]NIV53850.1 CoA transferase [Gammaproteobacteria bacterium]